MPNLPILRRTDLADLIPPNGVAVELGVAAGEFSAALLSRNHRMRLLISVDRWSDHHNDAERLIAEKRLAEFGDRSQVIHATFAEAAAGLVRWKFDLVYVDGYAHTGQDGGRTLREWWPMVKPGGIFAGHDYDAQHWPATFHEVNRFAAEYSLPINTTSCDQFASWWVRKPENLG